MRKKLTYNYWLMIVSWCMFLNNHLFLAILFSLLACAILTRISKRINYWRMSTTGLIIYIAISFILLSSNISYFFQKLPIYLAAVCLNCSLTNEYLYLFKPKFIVPYLLVMVINVSVFSIIIIAMPNSLYSLFTKNSLFLMEALIFLPYLIPVAYCLAYKKLRYSAKNIFIRKKEASLI